MSDTHAAATHTRPRGAAPKGHTWNAVEGVWVGPPPHNVKRFPKKRLANELNRGETAKKKQPRSSSSSDNSNDSNTAPDVKLIDVQRSKVELFHQGNCLRVSVHPAAQGSEEGGRLERLDPVSKQWSSICTRDAENLKGHVIVDDVVEDMAAIHAKGAQMLGLPAFNLATLIFTEMRAIYMK